MRRVIALSTLLAVGTGSIVLSGVGARGIEQGGGGGQAPAFEIQPVAENLYLITGGGGNTAAFVTEDGVVVVDTKVADSGQAILDQIRTVTDRPVTRIINTHTHADHTGSNDFFGASVEIVAHVNTRDNMTRMEAFQGDGAEFLPEVTYENRLTLGEGAGQIDLYYFGPGHTSGDSFVVFTALNTMHAGDMFPGKQTPIIDTANGGSAIHYGRTLTGAVGIPDVDRVITGHSTLMSPDDLREYAAFNVWFALWAEAEMRAGRSVEEAAEAFELPAEYADYAIGSMFGGLQGNIQTAYDELSR